MISQHIILTLSGMKLATSFIFIESPTVHESWKRGKGGTQGIFFTFVLNLGQYLLLEIYINLCFILPISFVSLARKLMASLMIKFFILKFICLHLIIRNVFWLTLSCMLILQETYISYFIIKIEKDFSTDLIMWLAEREVGSVDFLKLLN